MEALIVLAVTFVLLWVLFILPQQRRVRAHQALVASLGPGDRVILSAGIYGRIVDLGPEDLSLEIAPGVEIRVARQAVLRVVEDVTGGAGPSDAAEPADDSVPDNGGTAPPTADEGGAAPDVSDPDHRGPAAPGPNV
jgi:preprotein translocase subunit YajC